MAKYIGRSTIIEHKGLAKLKTFCANSVPYLVCRDETVTDVGIDGEIEVTLQNADGKTEATGQRLKFQLKSTESDNSYIRNYTPEKFEFYASADDLEYWAKHKQDVLLIIFDARFDKLYGKKLTSNDFASQKQRKRSYPITFIKQRDLLEVDSFDFHTRHSTATRERLCFDLFEPAITNLFRIRKHPQIIYSYETEFTTKQAVYDAVTRKGTRIPEFALNNKTIYTFVPPERQSGYFKTKIVKPETKRLIRFRDVYSDRNLRNHFIELIRIYFRKYLGTRGIYLNKNHNRYYFGIRPGEAQRSIFAKTRKLGKKTPKEVVKYYVYGKYRFYRHHAFKLEFLHGESIYVCLTPTYLLTLDGKNCTDGKTASRFIVPQKAQEFNPQVADKVHMLLSYLSNGSESIVVSNEDGVEIDISSYIPLELPFSIPVDDKGFPQYLTKRRVQQIEEAQTSLF